MESLWGREGGEGAEKIGGGEEGRGEKSKEKKKKKERRGRREDKERGQSGVNEKMGHVRGKIKKMRDERAEDRG